MAYRVAVHEIGHALVALDSGFAETVLVNLQTTYVEGAVVDGGRTTYQIEHDDIPGERFLTARIRICLAGMAAEEVLLGDRSTGSGGVNGCDLEEATNIAARMAASYGMGQSLRFVAPAMRVDRAFRSSPDLFREIDRILSREYDAAKGIVVSYRILAEVFVEQLIAQKSIEFNREQLASADPRLAN